MFSYTSNSDGFTSACAPQAQSSISQVQLIAGLSFSVPGGQPVPSSLKNIYREISTDCGCTVPKHGSLVKVSLTEAPLQVIADHSVPTVRAHSKNLSCIVYLQERRGQSQLVT